MAVTNDLIKTLSAELKLPTFKTRSYLKASTQIIGRALQNGQQVELPIGSFKLVHLPQRRVETEMSGEKKIITLPASIVPEFSVNPKIKESFQETPERQLKDEPATASIRPVSIANQESTIQFADLAGKTIPKPVLELVPENIARKFEAVPFALQEKTLSVAMTDPENEQAFNTLRKVTGKIVKPYLTTKENIQAILDQYSGLQQELEELVSSDEGEGVSTVEEKEEVADEEDVTESSPAAKIVSTILKRAVREKVSDIHIEPNEEEVTIRFRIDGVLRKILSLPKEIQSALISRIKILSSLKIDETRLPQDGRIQILLDGNKVDFRISTMPTVNGEKVVARVLDHAKGTLTFEQLGLRGRQLQILEDNTKKAHGMTLVTGPTGSGKSTTMYAIINRIKDVSVNIVTMEDPVEYRMPGVNQSQVNSKIGFTFANGLRSILRQDPDVVMVGEIRDRETADIAINAALTGHIVLSSLHTNDSAGALPRLIDMAIEPFLITSSTNAIVAQRLCRKICDQCREPVEIKIDELKEIEQAISALPEPEQSQAKSKKTFFHGRGCGACSNTGYRGRIGIFEVLSVTEPIKQLTLKREGSSIIQTEAVKEGLISMKQDGVLKALDGLTTIEEVWRVTKD